MGNNRSDLFLSPSRVSYLFVGTTKEIEQFLQYFHVKEARPELLRYLQNV